MFSLILFNSLKTIFKGNCILIEKHSVPSKLICVNSCTILSNNLLRNSRGPILLTFQGNLCPQNYIPMSVNTSIIFIKTIPNKKIQGTWEIAVHERFPQRKLSKLILKYFSKSTTRLKGKPFVRKNEAMSLLSSLLKYLETSTLLIPMIWIGWFCNMLCSFDWKRD